MSVQPMPSERLKKNALVQSEYLQMSQVYKASSQIIDDNKQKNNS